MADTITKVTRTSWLGRMKNSVGGILFGFLLIIIAVVILFKNEGRAIRTAKGLEEGSKAVVSLSNSGVDTQNEGKLIHTCGMVKVNGTLSDEQFNFNVPAIHYQRSVEMYQWVEKTETKKEIKTGGAEEVTTTYSYNREWRPDLIQSSSFQEVNGHQNPSSMPYSEAKMSANEVMLGEFKLSPSLISGINQYSSITPGNENIKNVPGATLDGNLIFIGKGSPASPQIGDIRISFKQVLPCEVSIVARQMGNNMVPYLTSRNTTIELLENGMVPADQMFANAQRDNRTLTWILRLVGFLMIFFGFRLIFAPIGVLVSVLPFLGKLADFGTGLVSFLLAFSIAFITIAIGWIVYRPVVGISLLVLGVGSLFAVRMLKKRNDQPVAE